MSAQPLTLEERINVALQPNTATTPTNLAALIEETETEIAKADQERTMDATLAANRIRPLLAKLRVRYEQVDEQEQRAAWLAEQDAAWLVKHDVLKRERDALAEEWREVYPDAASEIADLVVRTAANNEALAELNRDRPAGMEQHLLSAELHARGRDSFSRDTPSLLTSVCLFDWDSGRQICPPQRPSMASAFATSMVPAYNPADWASNDERRAVAQQRERQHMADFYARQTQQQEDRENKEARERFAASQRKNGI
jgi:hypothetical protein